MGSPPRCECIPRSFAVATKEVTVDQFRLFSRDHGYEKNFSPSGDCPMNMIDWFQAAAYCNWLSDKENIPRHEWCYPDEIGPEMTLPADFLIRTGYRLPTAAEWEFVCRALTATPRFYGNSVKLLNEYGWYVENSGDRTHPVGEKKPNDIGLFDLYGNALEWCQDAYTETPLAQEIRGDDSRVLRGGSFLSPESALTSAHSVFYLPGKGGSNMGLRVARTVP
jgi:formylglycine-generating enzyme required for sulfatase activity